MTEYYVMFLAGKLNYVKFKAKMLFVAYFSNASCYDSKYEQIQM